MYKRQGHIKDHLAVIYDEMLPKGILDEELAHSLAPLLFTHRISCTNRQIARAIIWHEEMKMPQSVSFVNGTAYFKAYTPQYSICLLYTSYHEKKLDEDGVGELFGLCCQKCKDTGGGTGRKTEPQITETVLEFFLRANARMSVFSMERAGKRLTARCGLNWSGTTYYDAWYFYRCAQMHRRLFVVAGRIAAELGEKVSSPEELEQRTQFAAVGGLTFHGRCV